MAEKRIKGITIEIGGNTTKLNDALKNVNGTIKNVNEELKDLNKALKLDPKNVELLAQKQELLKDKIKATTERLNTLKEAQRQMGDYNSLTDEQKEKYRALSVEISHAESSLKQMNEELKKSNNISLEKLNDSLKGVRETTGQIVEKLAKVGIAVGTALTALGTLSIKTYAEYEQLVGGVEKLFGESAKELQDYAQQAYKTAGISANKYMETATSFSASLIKGLNGDTRKAVQLTDRAIRDMSDNANTFGSSMDEIMNVYKALSKEQYTTLDNLRLGYAGTKEGMRQLIKDASTYTDIQRKLGVTVDASSLSFENIINAISVMQEKLGIAGTTSKEAEHTISGSVNQMKASWDNLLVAISDDNADMTGAVNNFVDSTITAGKNIVPRIKTAIEGIKKLINSIVRDVFPRLKREIPELKPIINIFEWFIKNKGLVITAIKAIIGAFVVTKIVDFTTKISKAFGAISDFANGSVIGKITVITGAVIALGTTISSLFSLESEEARKAREELEAHNDSLESNVGHWQDLTEAQEKAYQKSMNEISYYENLYKELQEIVDVNGKVKKGYEERAKFITGELSKAYGIEIDYVNGQIKGYGTLKKSIDDVIAKKKAEAQLSAQADKYAEAKENEKQAYEDYKYYQEQYYQKQKEYEKAKKEHNDAIAEVRRLEMISAKDHYDKSNELYDNYRQTIAQYEGNLEAYERGHYDKIHAIELQHIDETKDIHEQEAEAMVEKIKKAKTDWAYYTQEYERTGDEIYKIQADNAKRTLDETKKTLKEYSDKYWLGKKYVREAGVQFANGAVEGILSQKNNVLNTVKSLGTSMLSTLKGTLKIASPSKATMEIGKFVVEGIEEGIENEERGLLSQVNSLGNGMISGLMGNAEMAMRGLNAGIKTSLNPTINPTYAYDLNYQLMANAMKEALQEVDVELDDRKVGKFVNKVVSEEVFN